MNNLSQKDTIAEMAAKNGFWLYLEHLLVPPLAAEYRRAHDELRKEGWIITVKQNYKERSKNIYHYIPPDRQILPTPETHTEAPQPKKPESNSKVKGRGAFDGFYKLSHRDRDKLIWQCREIQKTIPVNHVEYKKISEQVERLQHKS